MNYSTSNGRITDVTGSGYVLMKCCPGISLERVKGTEKSLGHYVRDSNQGPPIHESTAALLCQPTDFSFTFSKGLKSEN
jgi:hypothetical protein